MSRQDDPTAAAAAPTGAAASPDRSVEARADGGPRREAPATRPASTRETAAVAGVLGRAFADDPVMAWIFPADADRARRATALFAALIEHVHGRHGGTYVAGSAGDPVAAAIWDPPGAWRVPVATTVRAMPSMVRALRFALHRAFVVSTLDERAHPAAPHWYLAYVGTEPQHQRQGAGGALLRAGLARADSTGLPSYLECSDPANVGFYERFGFRVVGEIGLPRGGPRVPTMWREAPGGSGAGPGAR
jgi:ribosomal protein S18 acetylase RimI-like enzyme